MVLRHAVSLTHVCIQQSLCSGLVSVHCSFLAGASRIAVFRHTWWVEAIPSKQVPSSGIRCPSKRLAREGRMVCPRYAVS